MGRAGGRWIADRVGSKYVRVDLQHIRSKTFRMILRYIYCDSDMEIFDDIVSTELDDFLDTVTDVMSCANELMLDRLSQISQSVTGRLVDTRNVCGLLNAVSPSSVREFKNAGLEYICLNLEAMLQGHYLNELDPELSKELDQVVRANQLACMPFAKSGRAEMLLHQRHPDLAAAIKQDRLKRINAIALQTRHQGMSTLNADLFDEDTTTTTIPPRKKSTHFHKEPGQTVVTAKSTSSKDLIFDMDLDFDRSLQSPRGSPSIKPASGVAGLPPTVRGTPLDEEMSPSKLASPYNNDGSLTSRTCRTPLSPRVSENTPTKSGPPWSLTPMRSKASMRNIMAQAASGRTSPIRQGLKSLQGPVPDESSPFSLPGPKVSQKDRKRQQAQKQSVEAVSFERGQSTAKPFSWQAISASRKGPAFKQVLQTATSDAPAKQPALKSSITPQLTMRQTLANSKFNEPGTNLSHADQEADLDIPGLAAGQGEAQNTKILEPPNHRPTTLATRHRPAFDLEWGLSMSEIVSQQQLEKDIIKDAVAKRNLQEIQAEQEFQEWWEKESARVQEAERRANATKQSRKYKARGTTRGKKAASETFVDETNI